MKKLIILFALLLAAGENNAQLLKKIKEKAAKAIEPKSTQNNSNSNDEPAASTKSSSNASATVPAPQAGPPANGKVVFSLAADEKFLYDETSIIYKNNELSYSFVLQNKKYEYFLVEDGKRSGPFKMAPLRSMKQSESFEDGGSSGDEINLGNDNKDAVALKYTKTIDGKLFIVFNAKNYGPYDHVAKMIVSPNQKDFFAVVTIGSENPMTAKMGMGKVYMVNNRTLKQRVGNDDLSIPMKFSVNASFTHCMATVLQQKTQMLVTATSSGKQQESSMADLYSSGNNATTLTEDGDILTIPAQSPTQVLLNGKEVASFKVPIKSTDRLFLTADLSKSLYYEKGKLYKADGSEENLSGIVFPAVLSTPQETAVYYFKVYTNDAGTKDVYLCKKAI